MIIYAKLNKGCKYILVVINTFTKYTWCEPLKNKTGREVTKAMEKILSQITPKNLQKDLEKEFYNVDFKKLMDKFDINHYSTYSSIKAGIVERAIRTLKTKCGKSLACKEITSG